MKLVKPISIKRRGAFLLESEWVDGFKASIRLESLRKTCPCAECRKDDLNERTPSFNMLATYKPGMNELKSLKPVGNYAVTAVWGDGHDTGIYTYDYLRQVFEENALSDDEVKKLDINNNNE